jgi:large subunit ribosomal protein L4
MPTAQVLSLDGSAKGQTELPDVVFARTGSKGLVWESVRSHLANQRQGTSKVKTRAEVSGTGKKPYRQKHTGRARHGSLRSPIHVGGGRVFGPHPREYRYALPKKARKQSLALALSARHAAGAVRVVEDFDVPVPKTKELVKMLTGLGVSGSVLLLVGTASDNMRRAARNVPWLTLLPASQVSPYHVLGHDQVLLTEQGLRSLVTTFGAAS